MTEVDNPYGVDTAMGRAALLFGLIAEGYDGNHIVEQYDITPERAEELIVLYVRRVLRGDAPAAPSADCLINGFNGWCMKHGCYHPAPANGQEAGGTGSQPRCLDCSTPLDGPVSVDGRRGCPNCGSFFTLPAGMDWSEFGGDTNA